MSFSTQSQTATMKRGN